MGRVESARMCATERNGTAKTARRTVGMAARRAARLDSSTNFHTWRRSFKAHKSELPIVPYEYATQRRLTQTGIRGRAE